MLVGGLLRRTASRRLLRLLLDRRRLFGGSSALGLGGWLDGLGFVALGFDLADCGRLRALGRSVLRLFGYGFRSRRTRLRGRDIAPALTQRLVEHHRAGRRGVERGHQPFHRQAHHLVTAFEHEATDALALATDHDRRRTAVIDLVVQQVAGLVRADDPDAFLLQRVDRLPEIHNVGDEQVFARAGAGFRDCGSDADGSVMLDDDAIDAGALRGSEEHSEVLRVLQRIDDQDERRLRECVEVQKELVQLDPGLALDDRDDALMVLDRRKPRYLHLVRVPDEDAALLRLDDELVHRAGARVAILRDVKSADVPSGADRFEDRVRTGNGLANGSVRRRGRVWACGDATDRFAIAALLASAALAPSPSLGSGTAGTTTPALRSTLTLRLAALVSRELAGLLALLAWEWLRRPERLSSELRPLTAELRALSSERRSRASRPAAPTPTSAPASAALLIAHPPRGVRSPTPRLPCAGGRTPGPPPAPLSPPPPLLLVP